MSRKTMTALALVALMSGCGSEDQERAAERPASKPQTAGSQATTPGERSALVGRWELRRTCAGVVDSLDRAGLRAIAPSVVGDYFPDQSPRQLARKDDVCRGAEPQQHSHFFTEDGQFGSLDGNGEQVDDAPYEAVDGRTMRITTEFGAETYRYRIVGGKRLTLEPDVPGRAKRAALAKPFDLSLAGHMAAVAYAGHTWKRVDCGEWC